ncbi:hypothetical protein HJG60_011805 [Phyllostomus discolor]|uniref:Uncharacterized protein n=1 Tax=Phyllostomus discolor TaxID=89673 RepID=A0A833ZIM5_9CHIR|nr:hypothetical protein HJG60_011805 [Phyllostomus discolor]
MPGGSIPGGEPGSIHKHHHHHHHHHHKTHQTASVKVTPGPWQHRTISVAKSRLASNHHSSNCVCLGQEVASGLEGTSQGLVAGGTWASAPRRPCWAAPGPPGCWLPARRRAHQGWYRHGLLKVSNATRRSEVPFKLPVTRGSGKTVSQGARDCKVGNSCWRVGRTSTREQAKRMEGGTQRTLRPQGATAPGFRARDTPRACGRA